MQQTVSIIELTEALCAGKFKRMGKILRYMSAIFYHNEDQKRLAEESKMREEKSKKIRTEILPLDKFYNAEGQE